MSSPPTPTAPVEATVALPPSSSTPLHSKGVATCRSCGVVGHRTEYCLADQQPQVIVHVVPSKKNRLTTHFQALEKEAQREEEAHKLASAASSATPTPVAALAWHPGRGLQVVDTRQEPELLFVRTPTPERFVQWVQHSPLFHRHFNSIFVSQWSERDVKDVSEKLLQVCQQLTEEMKQQQPENSSESAAASSPSSSPSSSSSPYSCSFRLQTHPKTLRAELISTLSPQIELQPHVFTHVLCAVKAYKRFFVGVGGKQLYHPTSVHHLESLPAQGASADDVLSRAYYKLAETALLDATFRTALSKPSAHAIDVGASPGGWSAFLASRGCAVLAVDPGVVNCSSPLVQHVPKLLQQATAEIDAFTQQGQTPFDIVVCDANLRPSEAASIIRSLCLTDRLSASAVLVLTCKETVAGRSKFLVAEAKAELEDYFQDFQEYFLLSNGKERTLVAAFRKATAEARTAIRERVQKEAADKQAAWEAGAAERLVEKEKKRKEKEEKVAKKKARTDAGPTSDPVGAVASMSDAASS